MLHDSFLLDKKEGKLYRGRKLHKKADVLFLKRPNLYKVLKPLVFCPSCFASIWGSAYFLSYIHLFEIHSPYWPYWMVLNSIGLIFVNSFLNDLYEKI